MVCSVCLGQDFLGTKVSVYLNFRGTFIIQGDTPTLSNFYLLNSIVTWKFLFIFVFKFELDVDSFGSRRGVDDSEVVSAIALIHQEIYYFYIKIDFIWPSTELNSGFPPFLLYWTGYEINIQCNIYHR